MFIRKPPMGWNSWNTFASNINEQLIFEMADEMVKSGLADKGYNYLVIDDCWAEKERDKDGRLVADKEKFPHGMKYVADYVHSKGLKFGMYSCCGPMTCAVYPGSFEHEFEDAETFASWEVDLLKYDYCFKPDNIGGDLLYKRMSTALKKSGRDILFSACSWGNDATASWIKSTGANIWRSTGDIVDSWASIRDITQKQFDLLKYSSQNCFNDMDMLVVGMHGKGNVGLTGCTDVEYKTHFSLWSLLNSPLFIGCDIREMSDETKRILMNEEVIDVNQQTDVVQPFVATNVDNERYAIVKPLDDGDYAIGLFNFTDGTQYVHFNLWDMGIPRLDKYKITLRDLWQHEELGEISGHYGKWLDSHDCMMLRMKIEKR